MPDNLLTPVLALVVWTLIIWIWMYATRIPAMQRAKIDPQEAARKRVLELPPEVMWARPRTSTSERSSSTIGLT